MTKARTYRVGFHLYDISRKGKFIEIADQWLPETEMGMGVSSKWA